MFAEVLSFYVIIVCFLILVYKRESENDEWWPVPNLYLNAGVCQVIVFLLTIISVIV